MEKAKDLKAEKTGGAVKKASPKKLNLYQKIHVIQTKLRGLSKDTESHNYKYVSGDKILGIIRPLMDELGLLLKQEILKITNERQNYEVWDRYKKEFRTKSEILSNVEMRFTWIDIDTGEMDVNLFGANGQNEWEKGLGSALTYGERYFLLKYFHIPTNEDDIDNPKRKKDSYVATPSPAPAQKPKINKIKEPTMWLEEGSEQWDGLLKSLDAGIKFNLNQITAKYKVSSSVREKLNNLGIK